MSEWVLYGDREVADLPAARVVHDDGDRGSGRHGGRVAVPLRFDRAGVGGVLAHEQNVQLGNVRVDRHEVP